MKAELIPKNGDPPIPITKDVTVVGRREYCDVKIDHPGLSKRHCVLVRTDGLLIIRDLATTNGTKLNGQKIRWAALRPNDRVSLAGYKAKVYLGPDNAPAPSELAAKGAGRGGPSPPMAVPAGSPPPAPVEVYADDDDKVVTASVAPLIELDADDDDVIYLSPDEVLDGDEEQDPLKIKLD